jgi:hypothetical protein
MANESVLNGMMPLGLTELSRRLGVDPFEAVRLLVATGYDLRGPLAFSASLVGQLRERGGVHESWWREVNLPTDASPARARVRAALQLLLDKGFVGERTTRMDNVWRGLPYEDQGLLQRALTALTREGLLVCVGTPTGLQVAVDASKRAAVDALAKGTGASAGLNALFEG